MENIKNVATLLEKNTVTWERQFSVTPEKLWQMVATKDGLAQWFMETTFEMELGGKFSFHLGWDGTISELVPLQTIVFIPEESQEAYLRFDIAESEGGCRFKLTDKMAPGFDASLRFPDEPDSEKYQPGGVGTHWSGVVSGYHGFVDSLEVVISGSSQGHQKHEDLNAQYCQLLKQWHAG